MQSTTSRRSETRPYRRAAGWLWLIALWCVLSGCAGGSGSSGFDVLAENAAIDQALDSDGCEIFEGLTICAAAPEPTASETPIAPAATPSETPTIASSDTPAPTNTQNVIDFTATPTSEVTATPTIAIEATPTPTSATTVAATPTGTPAAQTTPTGTGTPAGETATPTRTGAPVVPTATPTEFRPPGTATVTATQPRSPTARLTQTVRPTQTPIAATPTPTRAPSSPTPSATASPSRPNVATNVSASNTVPCRSETADTCTFTFEFRPIGLPSSAFYRVALRNRNPEGNWTVVAAPGNRAEISVQNTSPSDQYQFAVLVFPGDPGFVPDSVVLLSDTGADTAFVTPIITAARF
jgi:hypothetical protein